MPSPTCPCPERQPQVCPPELTHETQLLRSARRPSLAQPSTCSDQGSPVMPSGSLAPRCHPETDTPLLAPTGSPCYLLLFPGTETSPSAGTRSRFLEAPWSQKTGHQQAWGADLVSETTPPTMGCEGLSGRHLHTSAFSEVSLPTSWTVTCLPNAQHAAVGRDELALRIAEQHLVGAGNQRGYGAVAGRGQQLRFTTCIGALRVRP